MKYLVIFLSIFSLASDFEKLNSYNCETQNFDFQIKAIYIMQNRAEFYNPDKIKKLYASYYYHAQDTCKVNAVKWCEAYKRVNKSDYETFRSIYYFKCGGPQ